MPVVVPRTVVVWPWLVRGHTALPTRQELLEWNRPRPNRVLYLNERVRFTPQGTARVSYSSSRRDQAALAPPAEWAENGRRMTVHARTSRDGWEESNRPVRSGGQARRHIRPDNRTNQVVAGKRSARHRLPPRMDHVRTDAHHDVDGHGC